MIDLSSLLSLGRSSSGVVGIGLPSPELRVLGDLLRSIGSPVQLTGYADSEGLVSALRDGAIVAAVRGSLSSLSALKEIRRCFHIKEVMRTALLESRGGKPFMLTPVGIDEGRSRRQRLSLVRATVSYFRPLGWSLKTGVLAKGRPEDAGRGKEIAKSLEEAQGIASALVAEGIDAKHYGILFEDAVRDSDLIVAPDGVTGNLMFRSLHLVGGCKAYGAPIVNMDTVFVDTSRAKVDFLDSVLFAAGLAELKKRSF